MGTGFSKKKKEARMMQEQIGKMQQQMTAVEVTGTAANGLIEIKINGEHEVKSIKIKPECVDVEDIEGLQDLIKAAFNDAANKLKEQSMEGMKGFPNLSQFGF